MLRSDAIEVQYRALWILEVSLNFSAYFLAFLTILLNTCLAIDLVLMIRNPFKAKEVRVPFYLWGCIIVAFSLTASIFATVHRTDRNIYLETGRIPMYTTITMFASYFLINIMSVLYALKKICKPGISKETQKLVLVRHVVSIFSFMVSQLYIIGCIVYAMIPNWVVTSNVHTAVYTLNLLFISQGIYLPILRLSEPFFFHVIWQNLCALFCCCCRKENNRDKDKQYTVIEDPELDVIMRSISKDFQVSRIIRNS